MLPSSTRRPQSDHLLLTAFMLIHVTSLAGLWLISIYDQYLCWGWRYWLQTLEVCNCCRSSSCLFCLSSSKTVLYVLWLVRKITVWQFLMDFSVWYFAVGMKRDSKKRTELLPVYKMLLNLSNVFFLLSFQYIFLPKQDLL